MIGPARTAPRWPGRIVARARIAAACIAAGWIAACGVDPQSESAAEPPRSATEVVANFPPDQASLAARANVASVPSSQVAGPLAENPAILLEAFQNDLAACKRLVELMRSDHALADAIEALASGREKTSLAAVLRGARESGTKEIRHLVEHADQVRVGQAASGEPFAAALLPARGLYCAPSRERLTSIERLGPSPEAWLVREYFLTGALRAVRMPWEAAGTTGLTFEALLTEIESAARLYRGAERSALEGWIAGAISHLLREQTFIQRTDSTEARQQEGVVSAWIAMLEGIRSIRIDQARASIP